MSGEAAQELSSKPFYIEAQKIERDALQEQNRSLRLEEASLRDPERIEQLAGCTSCDIASFFSHRRDKGRTGRHLAFVAAG